MDRVGIVPLTEEQLAGKAAKNPSIKDLTSSAAVRTAVHSPAVMSALVFLENVSTELVLTPRIQKAISLRTRRLNGCFDSGITPEDAALGCDDLMGFQRGLSDDPREQAILALTTKIIRDRGKHTACVVDAARELGITDREIVETVYLAAHHSLHSYLHGISSMESELDNSHQSVKEKS